MQPIITTPEVSNIPEVELVYISGSAEAATPVINNPEDAYKAFMKKWDHRKINLVIECKIMLTDNAGKALAMYTVSSGGRTTAGIDLRMIFAAALKCAATGLFICVNHPAGKLITSGEEKKLFDTPSVKSITNCRIEPF